MNMSGHAEQEGPPQSTEVSLPSCMPFWQSETAHAEQGPPQSTPVSFWFLMPSEQVAAVVLLSSFLQADKQSVKTVSTSNIFFMLCFGLSFKNTLLRLIHYKVKTLLKRSACDVE
jgi:hypothetical protein